MLPLIAVFAVACGGAPEQEAAPAETAEPAAPEAPAVEMVEATEAVLEFPESVAWDASSDAWYVSNFGGNAFTSEAGIPAPMDADGNGFITKLRANGEIDTLRWVTGLHAPKGLAVHDGTLYVADVSQVVIIDIASGAIERTIAVDGSDFLNGLAVDASNGDVYVSDFMGNRIFRLPQGSGDLELFLESADLETPNGLDVDGSTLIVGAWGVITDPATFGTEVKGRIKLVDIETKEITHVGDDPIANIDGIIKVDDGYLISDWAAGTLMMVSPDGSTTMLASGYQNCADIGFDPDRRVVALPEMTPSGEPGRVSFFVLE